MLPMKLGNINAGQCECLRALLRKSAEHPDLKAAKLDVIAFLSCKEARVRTVHKSWHLLQGYKSFSACCNLSGPLKAPSQYLLLDGSHVSNQTKTTKELRIEKGN
jgi:hypothetical protein